MADTRHKAVWDWLLTCPHIGDLFFNASRAEDGNTQLIPSEDVLAEFIDGSKKIMYNVALTRFVSYTTDPNDEANIVSLVDFEAIADWIEERMEAGDVPDFPDNCTVCDISVLPSRSGWLAVQDMTQAKYMIQFRIEYIREARAATARDAVI